MRLRGLYGIADAGWGDPVVIGAALAAAGCGVIQLRAKGWSAARIAAAGAALLPVLHTHGSKLIINDHLAVAARIGADGVHLGQDDGALDDARRALPPSALIGYSTHTLAQVDAAQGADYIGFGPVFTTDTKVTGVAARGVALLAQAVARSRCPVVAIGGINARNLADVQGTGAESWAVISAILGAADLGAAVRQFQTNSERESPDTLSRSPLQR